MSEKPAEERIGKNALREMRVQKMQDLRKSGINPFPYKFERTITAAQIHATYADLSDGEETDQVLKVAGRIMSMRNTGMFIDLHDDSGKIQIFSHKQYLADEDLALLKKLDIGDFIGITGYIRRTPRGELTINTTALEVLSKALLPLPEKYHGLTDVETRYRQRYLDLIINEDTRTTLRKRSQIVSAIRRFLEDRGFLEVETPMLHAIPGGASALPFITHHNTLDIDLYLRIAPELFLKRLIIGGLSERIFEINRCFRNEGISTRHNPEFTTLELYQAYTDYQDMMDITEEIVRYVCKVVLGTTTVKFGDIDFDFGTPWRRASMIDLIKEETGLDFLAIETLEAARQSAQDIGVPAEHCNSWGKVIEEVFAEKVEPTLIQPTHVTDFPRDISPLAKEHRDNPRLTERFETYVNTWEIANAFSELTDPIDQRERFEAQVEARESGDDEAQLLDEDFINALEHGMPPCGGLGIGIDRLVMLLTNSPTIREVIAFPTMRQKQSL